MSVDCGGGGAMGMDPELECSVTSLFTFLQIYYNDAYSSITSIYLIIAKKLT